MTDELGISKTLAAALLIKFGWNTSLAKEKVLDSPSLATLVTKLFKFDPDASKPKTPDVCPSCYDEATEWVKIEDCGHQLCKECYQNYLVSKLGDGHECVFAFCPDSNCNLYVPDHLFLQLLPKDLISKYEYFKCQSYVNLTKRSKFCPGINCTKIC